MIRGAPVIKTSCDALYLQRHGATQHGDHGGCVAAGPPDSFLIAWIGLSSSACAKFSFLGLHDEAGLYGTTPA